VTPAAPASSSAVSSASGSSSEESSDDEAEAAAGAAPAAVKPEPALARGPPQLTPPLKSLHELMRPVGSQHLLSQHLPDRGPVRLLSLYRLGDTRCRLSQRLIH